MLKHLQVKILHSDSKLILKSKVLARVNANAKSKILRESCAIIHACRNTSYIFFITLFFPSDLNFTVQLVSKRLGLWPSTYDLEGASNALLRLWRVYKLDLDDFIDGRILNYTADQPLSTEEVLAVTSYADATKDDYSEMKWLEALYRRLTTQGGKANSTPEVVRVGRKLAASYYKVRDKFLIIITRIINFKVFQT